MSERKPFPILDHETYKAIDNEREALRKKVAALKKENERLRDIVQIARFLLNGYLDKQWFKNRDKWNVDANQSLKGGSDESGCVCSPP